LNSRREKNFKYRVGLKKQKTKKNLILKNLFKIFAIYGEFATGKKVGIELKNLFNYWRRFGIYNPLLMPSKTLQFNYIQLYKIDTEEEYQISKE
jgi:hypothetical protein